MVSKGNHPKMASNQVSEFIIICPDHCDLTRETAPPTVAPCHKKQETCQRLRWEPRGSVYRGIGTRGSDKEFGEIIGIWTAKLCMYRLCTIYIYIILYTYVYMYTHMISNSLILNCATVNWTVLCHYFASWFGPWGQPWNRRFRGRRHRRRGCRGCRWKERLQWTTMAVIDRFLRWVYQCLDRSAN